MNGAPVQFGPISTNAVATGALLVNSSFMNDPPSLILVNDTVTMVPASSQSSAYATCYCSKTKQVLFSPQALERGVGGMWTHHTVVKVAFPCGFIAQFGTRTNS